MKKFTDKEIEELATEYVLNECSDCNDDLGYGFEAGFKKALELMGIRKFNGENEIKKLKIGVISPYKRLFDDWVHKNKNENEKYIWINRIDNLWGCEFSRIEETIQCNEIKNYNELIKVALCCVK